MREQTKTSCRDNLELLAAYRAGDEAAGEKFVVQNQPLVYHVAARFSGRAELSDLWETGTVGLVKAMKTFDFSMGYTFSTYAVPLIFGEIRRFLRDDGIVKVSREEKRLCVLLNAEKERRAAAGEDTSIEAIARAVGVEAAVAASAVFALTPVRSLDEAAFDADSPTTLADVLSDEEEQTRTFDRMALRMALEKLPEQRRKIILLRYFRDLSQAQTARLLGITQVKVSREEKRILEILRQELS